MNSIKQTRFFAQNYPNLQGLRAVPLGFCLLIVTVWANLQNGPARDLTFPITASLICLAAYMLIDQYYNRVYCKVKRTISHAEVLLQVTAGVLALAAFIIDTSNKTNFSFLSLVFAAVFAFSGFWYWRSSRLLLITSLFFALIFTGLGVVSLMGVENWWRFFGLSHSLLAFTSLYGIFCVLAGIISHIYFVKALPPMSEAA